MKNSRRPRRFGHPYSEHTGADWKSKTHIDCVAAISTSGSTANGDARRKIPGLAMEPGSARSSTLISRRKSTRPWLPA